MRRERGEEMRGRGEGEDRRGRERNGWDGVREAPDEEVEANAWGPPWRRPCNPL